MLWRLTCGLRLGLKFMLVEDGPLMEGWPMGELMTGNGEGRPLMVSWGRWWASAADPGWSSWQTGWAGTGGEDGYWSLGDPWRSSEETTRADQRSLQDGERKKKSLNHTGNFRNILLCEVNNSIVFLFGLFTEPLNGCGKKFRNVIVMYKYLFIWENFLSRMAKITFNFKSKRV